MDITIHSTILPHDDPDADEARIGALVKKAVSGGRSAPLGPAPGGTA